MLGKRLISAAVLIPLVVVAVIIGGWAIVALLIALAGIAAWEFWRMFSAGGYHPSAGLLISGTVTFIFFRFRALFTSDVIVLVIGVFVIASAAWHTYRYEKGITTSAIDFCIDMGGMIYIGFLASFIVSLREIPVGGMWWTLLSICAIAFADSAAYFVGRAFGKHKMMPQVSPKKSWEGYLGGILVSCLLITLIALFLHPYQPAITWWKGLILAAVISIIAPFGDFAESMLKRQCNIKDSSNLIPGHGGVFDRMDSYLWMGILAYYLVVVFF